MMKRLLNLSLASLAAMTLLAGTPRSRVYTTDAFNNKTYYELDGKFLPRAVSQDEVKRKSRIHTQRKSQSIIGTEAPKRLNVEIVYDENEMVCEAFCVGMMDACDLSQMNPPKNIGEIEVPSGIKGMLVLFGKYDSAAHKQTWYANFKDISKLENGAKVLFDPSECVHKVSYKPLGEDGNYIDLEKRNGDSLVEAGELAYGFSLTTLSHVDDGMLWMVASYYGSKSGDDGTSWLIEPGDFYVNTCGEDFYLGQHIVGMPSEGRNFTLIEMPVYQGTSDDSPSEAVLSNDPARYQNYVRKWTRSPYSVASNKSLLFGAQLKIEQGDVCYFGIGGDMDMKTPIALPEMTTRLKVCSNNPNAAGSELERMICVDIMPESGDMSEDAFASMFWRPGEDGREYIAINHMGVQTYGQPYEVYMNFIEDNYDGWLRTKGAPNPYLAFDDAKIKGTFGNNTPIISMSPSDYWDEEFGSDLVRWYMGVVGRYGEGNSFGSQQLIEYREDDKYDSDGYRKQTATYDNILIDGEVDGNVTAELYVKRGKGAGVDFIPPVLTWLGFKDKDENLTDRFRTGADGTLEFYATDFYLTKDWSLGKYDFFTYKCKSIPTVKVEYAPYGSTGFNELPVKEIEEKFFYPGWGSFYSTPLEKVDKYSENGWYDLRISLEDATGNRHVQTLSPAFKLLDFTGVETVTDTDADEAKAYYNLQGVRVDNPGNGIYIEVGSEGSRKVVK